MEWPWDPVTWEDIAVYFTRDEWLSLKARQKELYKEVMVDNIRNLCSLDQNAVKPEIMLKFLMGNVPYGDYTNSRTSVESGLPGEEKAVSLSVAGIGTCLTEEIPRGAKVQTCLTEEEPRGAKVQTCLTEEEPRGAKVQIFLTGEKPKGEKVQTCLTEEEPIGAKVQIQPALTVETYADCTTEKSSEVHNLEAEEPCSQNIIIEDLSEEQQPYLCSEQEETEKLPVVQEAEVKHMDVLDPPECGQPADCQELLQHCNQEECQKQTEQHEPMGSPKPDGCPESDDSPKSAVGNKPSPDESNSEEKLYICASCGETFDVWKFLVRHFIVHGGMKPYQCPDCQKCFTYPSKLTTHRKTHQRQKSHPCPDCGRCFTHHSNLLIHQKTHSGEKPHMCPDCGKCFIYKSKLVTHQKTHNGSKPHSCPDCDKTFVYRCKLLVHQESHNGQKPFHCTVCEKGFPRKSSLVIHMRRHTGERPFVCHICSRGFVEHAKLRRHIRVHTGEKPFGCDICGKCFNDSSTLSRHKRMHFPPGTVKQNVRAQKKAQQATQNQNEEVLNTVNITPHIHPLGEPVLHSANTSQHLEPEHDQTLKHWNISKHIKTEREDMIDISQHQPPQNESYSKSLHVTEHPKPQTVHKEPQKEHQMTFSDMCRNIKSEKEDLLPIDQQAEQQHSQVLEWSSFSQPMKTQERIQIKVERGLSTETQPKEVMKWSVNGQEVKTQNEFAFDRLGDNQNMQEDIKPVLKWPLGNQRMGNQAENMLKVTSQGQHLQPIDPPVQKWTVDSQRVEALNDKILQPLPTSAQSEHKLKCLDCGLRYSSLAQFVNHRRIHRMQRKRRLNNVYRGNLLSQVPSAVRLGGLNHISQNIAMKNQGLNTGKHTYHVNEFDVSERESKLGVSLQALQQGYFVADTIRAQVANDIQMVKLE